MLDFKLMIMVYIKTILFLISNEYQIKFPRKHLESNNHNLCSKTESKSFKLCYGTEIRKHGFTVNLFSSCYSFILRNIPDLSSICLMSSRYILLVCKALSSSTTRSLRRLMFFFCNCMSSFRLLTLQ